jgi:NitT/TauT family transport system permease protein
MKRRTNESAPSRERERYLRQSRRQIRHIRLCRWGFLALLVLAWEGAAELGLIDSFIFSRPSRIWRCLLQMKAYDLPRHIGTTVGETLVGFLLGVVFGTLLAIILWWSPAISRVCEPYLVVLNSLPKIALGPVIIILAGAGTRAIIFMALAISLVVTVLEMLHGFYRTDPEYIRMAETFGANRRQIFCKIVFPYNIATLFTSLKINIGLSLVGVIAGEFLVSRAGLGYLIVYGGQVFKLDLVMSAVFILCVLAAAMYALVALLERMVIKNKQ